MPSAASTHTLSNRVGATTLTKTVPSRAIATGARLAAERRAVDPADRRRHALARDGAHAVVVLVRHEYAAVAARRDRAREVEPRVRPGTVAQRVVLLAAAGERRHDAVLELADAIVPAVDDDERAVAGKLGHADEAVEARESAGPSSKPKSLSCPAIASLLRSRAAAAAAGAARATGRSGA